MIRNTLRASDAIYRVGGEEFLIVLPAVSQDAAKVIAQRLCDAVRERKPGGVEVTVSIGVASSVDGGLDTDEMVARADSALYAAKEGGATASASATATRPPPESRPYAAAAAGSGWAPRRRRIATSGKTSVEMIAAPTSPAAVEDFMWPWSTAIAVMATTSGSSVEQ